MLRIFVLLMTAAACYCHADNADGNGAVVLALQERISGIYKDNKAAVVTVYAAHESAQQGGRDSYFVGTGFFISKDGHILTNTNVIHGADRLWVEREGVGYLAELVGADAVTNVAILKALALPPGYKFLRFSEDKTLPEVGSLVVSLTSELGMSPGPSMGIVNGRNTRYGERILPTVYLRADIPFDGGEGGAPVFDINGALVGMMIVALPEIRSSFVLPARAIERIRDDILFAGEVKFAHYGFTARQVPDMKVGPRVVVEALEANGPSKAAGIREGDVLVKVGDYDISTEDDLRAAFFFTRPEELVTMTVRRKNEPLTVQVKVGVRESPPTAIPSIHHKSTEPRPPEGIPGLPKEESPKRQPAATGDESATNVPAEKPIAKKSSVAEKRTKKAPSE